MCVHLKARTSRVFGKRELLWIGLCSQTDIRQGKGDLCSSNISTLIVPCVSLTHISTSGCFVQRTFHQSVLFRMED